MATLYTMPSVAEGASEYRRGRRVNIRHCKDCDIRAFHRKHFLGLHMREYPGGDSPSRGRSLTTHTAVHCAVSRHRRRARALPGGQWLQHRLHAGPVPYAYGISSRAEPAWPASASKATGPASRAFPLDWHLILLTDAQCIILGSSGSCPVLWLSAPTALGSYAGLATGLPANGGRGEETSAGAQAVPALPRGRTEDTTPASAWCEIRGTT